MGLQGNFMGLRGDLLKQICCKDKATETNGVIGQD
jgi:hypothetical protein